jgi:hypothetical protein
VVYLRAIKVPTLKASDGNLLIKIHFRETITYSRKKGEIVVFEYASATFPGRDHIKVSGVLVGKNNQDAYHLSTYGGIELAITADGCGSYSHSEVGSTMIVRLLTKAIRANLRRTRKDCDGTTSGGEAPGADFWLRVREDCLTGIRATAMLMADDQESLNEVIRQYFSASISGALVTAEYTQFFSLGDGVCSVNGTVVSKGEYPGNKPPYLSYCLVSSDFDDRPELLKFQVMTVPTSEISWYAIGSDGVLQFISAVGRLMPGNRQPLPSLEQIALSNRFFENPEALRRVLVLANNETTYLTEGGRIATNLGLLLDDCTVIIGRRVRKQESTENG